VTGSTPTEHRAVTAGPDSGEVTGFHARRAVPDAIDPSMLAQERPGAQPLPDLPECDAGVEQLHALDDPMRPRRQLPDHRFYRAGLMSHCDT
jgi:hypothetical protein